MNSAFNDSVSESKIEQALAECAALTRVNDPRRALNIGRMIEAAHFGQPRVLARVARMYSDLGLQDESARVLRGLQSAVRPSAPVPRSPTERRPVDEFGELPSFGDDDNETTQAKSFDEFTHGLPGVPTLLSSVPPPPVRSSGAAPVRSSGAAPQRSSGAAPQRSSGPAPQRSSGLAAQRSSGPPLGSQLPPPPMRSSGPPPGSRLPPPPMRSSGPPLGSQLPPPPVRSSLPPPGSQLPPPPVRGMAGASSVPPPPPRAGPPLGSSLPPAPRHTGMLASSVPPVPGRAAPSALPPPPWPASAPPYAGAPAPGLNLPPARAYATEPPADAYARDWNFDEDDNEPTRAFAPPAGLSSRPPAGYASGHAHAFTDGAWRDRIHELKDKTLDSFEHLKQKSSDSLEHLKQKSSDSFEHLKQKSSDSFEHLKQKSSDSLEYLKQKSSDQLRRISSRPPPPPVGNASVAPARVVAPEFSPAAERYEWEPRRSGLRSTRMKLLAAFLVVGLALFFVHRHTRQHQEELTNDLTQARPLLWSTDVDEVKQISKHLAQSFEPTGYGNFVNSVASSLGSDGPVFESLEPAAQLLALRQYAALRLLDPKTDPKQLEALLGAVKAAKVPAEELRFAELLPALDQGPGAATDSEALDPALKHDPLALLISGILLERVGKVELAAERYTAAAKEQAEWHLPLVYATRLALLTRGADTAKPQLEKIQEAARVDPKLGVISRGLYALNWVVDTARTRELPDSGKLSEAEFVALPPVLAQVPSLVQLVQAMLDEKDELKPLLTKAIERADGPALLVQLAGFAAAVNQGELVDAAIERVQVFAKGYTPAKALAARMQLGRGDFAAARQTATAAGLDVSSIDAVEAYENQDAKNLSKAIDAMPAADKDKPEYGALLLAEGILSGHDYPSAGKLDGVLRTNGLWAELIAADAALDQGDLDRAHAIIEAWADNERTPLHQIRVARYERYKGRTRTAVSLSQKVLDQETTSSRALIEHLSALLADDRLPAAIKLFSDALYKDMLKPHERWVDALLIGKDKGWMAANVITSYLQPPTRKEALSLQLLGLRAMCVGGDPRAGVYLKRLGADVPENPDYLLAKSEY